MSSSSSINSWCGRFFISTFCLIISIFIVDYKANILPIKGICLGLYMILIIILTVWGSCILIQRILKQNQAYEFDFENKRYLKLFKNACKTLRIPINFDLIAIKTVSEHGSSTPKVKKVADVIDAIPILKKKVLTVEPTKNIDDRIEQFAEDIEKRFVTKWYAYISEDKNFLSENKILLEAVTRRVLQVSVNVDSDKILCGCLVILLKHLKEYRKAIKRAKKSGNSVKAVYRYAHIGNKSEAAFKHGIHRLTENILQEFINWELWNSLPCRLLVSILARRLTAYVIRYMSQPGFINYRLISLFATEKISQQLELPKFTYISLFNIDEFNENIKKDKDSSKIIEKKIVGSTPQISPKKEKTSLVDVVKDGEHTKIDSVIHNDSESMVELALTKMITQHTAPILQRAEKNLQEKEIASPPISAKNTPEHSNKFEFSPKRSEPVKIHSAKSTSKHWGDSDVGNVSVGQDLLALDGIENSELECFSGCRLWGPSVGNEFMEKNTHPLWDINEIFKDKENSIEGDDKMIREKEDLNKMSPKLRDKNKDKGKERKTNSPPVVQGLKISTTNAASIITNTIGKPIGNVTASTLHKMGELQQSTVNNVVKPVSNATEKAIHKIGDLQDEAVGVVEGIFDFGMAGIRKGLRLTGLQDSLDSTQKTRQQQQQTQSVHLQHQKTIEQSPKNMPKLVKVGHITSEDIKKSSQDSIDSSIWINPIAKESPNGFENQMLFEKSPNVEQSPEKVVNIQSIPNVATETNQFFTESPEYEETADLASTISKLRNLLQQKSSESSLNTPAASPMPVEEKTCSTPTEPTIPDAIRTDGGIQKFARTVTGMFNTFKGALPGNIEPVQAKSNQWIFVENETSNTVLSSLLNSLLIERRDYCTVDTAYEAMDTFDIMTESTTSTSKKILWDNQTFEDEFDDFDTSIPITKALLDVLCECLLDTNCALKQEPVMRSILVLTGKKLESILSAFAFKMLRFLNKAVGPLPKNDNDLPMTMDIEKMVRILEEAFPNSVKNIFGEKDIKTAIKFFISSLQNQKINHDIVLQLAELICSQFIFASSQMSPTPSA